MNRKHKTIYYTDYSDDVVVNSNQDYEITENYVYIHHNPFYRLASGIVYVLAAVIGFFYVHLWLRMSIRNRNVLKESGKNGYFLYSNHTQPIGDVILPGFVVGTSKRMYTVVSQANLGIKGIGKVLPLLGALPIPEKLHQMGSFQSAVETRAKEGHVIAIFPEAHVWPYYTKIRPFSVTSFHFPVDCDLPVYSMTVTYQKAKWGKKPQCIIYVDGPFRADKTWTKKEQRRWLHDQVYQAMLERSKNSNIEYIHYEKRSNGEKDEP